MISNTLKSFIGPLLAGAFFFALALPLFAAPPDGDTGPWADAVYGVPAQGLLKNGGPVLLN